MPFCWDISPFTLISVAQQLCNCFILPPSFFLFASQSFTTTTSEDWGAYLTYIATYWLLTLLLDLLYSNRLCSPVALLCRSRSKQQALVSYPRLKIPKRWPLGPKLGPCINSHNFWSTLIKFSDMSSGNTSSTQILLFKLDKSKKFTRENWTAFEMIMMAKRGLQRLINYWENYVTVPGPALFPTQTTNLSSLTPNEYKYAQRESSALSSIIHNVTDVFSFGLDTWGILHAAWTRLKTQYGMHSDLVWNCRETILWVNTYEEGDKVSGDGGHIEKMRCLLKEANDAGAAINEETFITILLDSFPESWGPVVSILPGEKDLMVVIACLSAYGERLAGRGKIFLSPTSSTMTISNQVLQASIDVLVLQVQSLLSCKDNVRPSNGRSHPVNEHCKGIGHTMDECWKNGGEKQGQYPPWWKGK